MTTLPPPGWYADPEHPGMLRYWTGSAWSEHRAPPPAARPAATGSGLSNIGDWLSESFNALRARWVPIAVVVGVVAAASWLLIRVAISRFTDVRYAAGDWSGVSGGDFGVLALAGFGLGALTFFSYVIVAHQLYHARLGVHQPLSASAGAALRSIPRAIGWAVVIALAVVVWVVVVAVLAAASGALGVLAFVASVPVFVWLAVKIAFFAPAVVVPVDGMHTFAASADVSRGRFWPVLGRLLLLGALSFVVSLAVNIATAAVQPSVDADDLDDYVVTNSQDEIVFLDVGGILDELDIGGLSGVIASLPMSVLGMYQLAALSVLYAETHQVRPGAPTQPANS